MTLYEGRDDCGCTLAACSATVGRKELAEAVLEMLDGGMTVRKRKFRKGERCLVGHVIGCPLRASLYEEQPEA